MAHLLAPEPPQPYRGGFETCPFGEPPNYESLRSDVATPPKTRD
jgi:hypothetical protein